MPQCGRCGKQAALSEELALLRGEDGHFYTHCRSCLEEEGVPWPSSGFPEGLLLAESAHVEAQLENMGDAIGFFQIEETDDQAYARQFSRHDVRLTIRYHLEFDKRMHEGEVLDLSRGGLRFRARTPLIPGQVILLDVVTEANADVHTTLRSRAKVCHVARLPDRAHEIGVEFFQTGSFQHRDRRGDPRYPVGVKAYYRHRGKGNTVTAQVLDISRSGIRLMVEESIPVGDLLLLVLQSEGDAGHQVRMRGVVRVQRSIRLSEKEYELGALFLSRNRVGQ